MKFKINELLTISLTIGTIVSIISSFGIIKINKLLPACHYYLDQQVFLQELNINLQYKLRNSLQDANYVDEIQDDILRISYRLEKILDKINKYNCE
jgi:hypothetical protein